MTPTQICTTMLDDAKRELAELQDKVRVQQKVVEYLEAKLASLKEESLEDRLTNSGRIPKQDDDTKGLPAVTRIFYLLKEEGKPMRLTTIKSRLADPEMNVSVVASALSRRTDLFVKKGRGLYGLKEWDQQNGKGQ